MSETLVLVRFAIGRALIHAGLRVMPLGRVRAELTVLLWDWGQQVRVENERSEHP